MVPKKNVMAALEMYYLRLDQIKKEICEIVAKGAVGGSQELEAELTMSIIEVEVRDIYQCVKVLDSLLHRC